MKKLLSIFFVLMVLLAACSTNNQDNKAKENKKSTSQKIAVDKGLLSVTITIPASMYEGQNVDDVIADAKKKGIKVTKNKDGSLTYKMSKSEHREMMKDMKKSVVQSVTKTKSGKDYPSIKDITYNHDFSQFTLVVDKGAYENSMDGFAALGLGMEGMMYQLFNGANPDDDKVTILVKDQATQKVFDQIVYPDDLKDPKTK